MRKKLFLLLIAVLALLLALAVGIKTRPYPKPETTPNPAVTAEVISLKTEVEGATPFGLLEKYTQEKQISLQTKVYSFGILVESIGTKTNTAEKAWIYFVNGKSGEVAADRKALKSGDLVEWKYLKPEF